MLPFYHAIVLLAFTHLKHTSDFKVDWKGLARILLCYAGVYMLQPNEEGRQPRSRENVQEYLAQWEICMPRLKRLRKLSLPTILKFPSWSSCREIFIVFTALGKHRWGKAEEENSCHAVLGNTAMVGFLHVENILRPLIPIRRKGKPKSLQSTHSACFNRESCKLRKEIKPAWGRGSCVLAVVGSHVSWHQTHLSE